MNLGLKYFSGLINLSSVDFITFMKAPCSSLICLWLNFQPLPFFF